MLSSISNFVSSLFARPEPEPRPEPLRPATGMHTFLVTRHSQHGGETALERVPVASVVEEESDDDEGPAFGCWLPPKVGQTWPERLESLKQRAAAVGLNRVTDNMYAVNGFRSIIRVDECNHHMLFPGEQPSREPHFHGLRYMTQAEMDDEMEDSSEEDSI